MQPWMIAIVVPIGAFAVPIVWILTAHQRRMAEIIHRNQAIPASDIEAIKHELRDMRMLMNQHTIALDDLRVSKSGDGVQQRLGTPQ